MTNDLSITVYTKPACVQCDATKRVLSNLDVPYSIRDLSTDADARDYVLALSYSSAPVVVAGGEHWSGFRPDRLAAVAKAVAA